MRRTLFKITQYFVLLLFLGYYASITLFSHVHHINNITIVHSHPFRSDSHGNPIEHNHSKNQYIVIELLTHFVSTFIVFYAGLTVNRSMIYEIATEQYINYLKPVEYCSNLLRAPPFGNTFLILQRFSKVSY